MAFAESTMFSSSEVYDYSDKTQVSNEWLLEADIPLLLGYVINLLLGVGNELIIVIFFIYGELQTPMNTLVVAMAFVDSLVCHIYIPICMYEIFTHFQSTEWLILCRARVLIRILANITSVGCILCITLLRLRCVIATSAIRLSRQKALVITVLVSLIAFFVAVSKTVDANSSTVKVCVKDVSLSMALCRIIESDTAVALAFNLSISFVILVSYVIIGIIIHLRTARIAEQSNKKIEILSIWGGLLVAVMFIVSFVIPLIMLLVLVNGNTSTSHLQVRYRALVESFLTFHAGMNPILYFRALKGHKRKIFDVLRRRLRMCRIRSSRVEDMDETNIQTERVESTKI